MIKNLPVALWIVVAVLLVIAVLKMPYGYYTFLRLVVCAFCAFMAYQTWKVPAHLWAIAFGLVAILFNPLVIVGLKRDVWFFIDLGTAAFILCHLWFGRLRTRKVIPR